MKHLFYALASVLVLGVGTLKAQDAPAKPVEMKDSERIPRNFVRTNLTSILLNNFTLQYERILTRRLSIGFEYRIMPDGNLPFSTTVSEQLSDNPDISRALMDIQIGGTSFTPSVKIYPTRKGYGRGFYFSAFVRSASYSASDFNYYYDNGSNFVKLSGDFKSTTAGVTIGKQWTFGKFFVLDWTIAGGGYGSARGNFVGRNSEPLDEEDRQTVEDALNSLDLPGTDVKATVTPTRTTVKMSGPWGSFRTGVSIGIRF